jgi:tetratricopeptide (TPR) repeat protein
VPHKPSDDTELALQRRFAAEAAYAESMFQQALGDIAGSVAAAERALEFDPDYAPALLTVGSIDFQRGREEHGAELFRRLPTLPDTDGDLREIVDRAGDFLIQERRYAAGLELYREACSRFQDRPELFQGLACCAGHEGLGDLAVDAARRALALAPERVELMSDLGWCLIVAGDLAEAEEVLANAVALEPDDELALANLRHCRDLRSRGD